jgi:hypothetical protein
MHASSCDISHQLLRKAKGFLGQHNSVKRVLKSGTPWCNFGSKSFLVARLPMLDVLFLTAHRQL